MIHARHLEILPVVQEWEGGGDECARCIKLKHLSPFPSESRSPRAEIDRAESEFIRRAVHARGSRGCARNVTIGVRREAVRDGRTYQPEG